MSVTGNCVVDGDEEQVPLGPSHWRQREQQRKRKQHTKELPIFHARASLPNDLFVVYHENPAFAMEFPCGAASGVIYYNKPGGQLTQEEALVMTRIVKENYYLDIAETVLERSTCLRRQYGAIIVRNDEIVASGYNGAPRGRKNCCDLGYCVREQMRIRARRAV